MSPFVKQECFKRREPGTDESYSKSYKDFESMHLYESADSIEMLDAIFEDDLIESHIKAIREDAQLLRREGELIETAQDELEHDMELYVERMEGIAQRKVAVYTALLDKLSDFKSHFAG